MIKVRYSAVDGYRKTKTFKSIAGARRYAQEYVGVTPERGSSYAVSGDGIGKVTVEGATLDDLFPATAEPKKVPVFVVVGVSYDSWEAARQAREELVSDGYNVEIECYEQDVP